MRRKIGWNSNPPYRTAPDSPEMRNAARSADLLVTGLRDASLFEERTRRGLPTVYSAERWFKPRHVCGVMVPGSLKMLSPAYHRQAMRIARLLDSKAFHAMPIGVHAVRDMARAAGLAHGVAQCMFSAPPLVMEGRAGGRVLTPDEAREFGLLDADSEASLAKRGFAVIPPTRWRQSMASSCHKLGLPSIRLGAYYVANGYAGDHSSSSTVSASCRPPVRILWVGRYLPCKHVPSIVRAFRHLITTEPEASLLLVGEGAEFARCVGIAGDIGEQHPSPAWVPSKVVFSPFVKNETVRHLMREATLYTMASDAVEGWGAVVSEALSEGCEVISSAEVGGAATMLSHDHLFDAGDEAAMSRLMMKFGHATTRTSLTDTMRRHWSGEAAADWIMQNAQ